MLAVDGVTRILGYANPACYNLLGLLLGDVVGRLLEDVLPGDISNDWAASMDRLAGASGETRVGSDDRWACSAWTIVGEHQERLGTMVQLTDISAATFDDSVAMNEALLISSLHQHELRAASETLNARLASEILSHEETQAELLQSTLMLELRVEERTKELESSNREMQGFVYSIAHDLRAPLRAIIATSKILIEEVGPGLAAEGTILLRRQIFNSSRLSDLIDDLLEFARLAHHEVRRRPVDITAWAKQSARIAQDEYPGRGLKFDFEEGLTADADLTTTRIVLQNLMDNAAKFSPNGGTISVGFRDGAFFVRDEGIGFNMAYHQKLFLPFQRLVLDSEFPGTGIGLANVERIVVRHGGKVWAESNLGHGATFWFTLGSA